MRTLPHFLCIGAQKAGTSWLYKQLSEHPDVWMPPVKELHYFNTLYVPQNRRWTKQHLRNGTLNIIKQHITSADPINFEYIRYLSQLAAGNPFTEDWYKSIFNWPAARFKILGDITPEYSTIPDAGVKYVRSLLGAVKIIYIIRNPLKRALSQLRMNASRHLKGEICEADWMRLAQGEEILDRGDYMEYVPRWKKEFGGDILFLPYGRIASRPEAVLAEIGEFLQLPAYEYQSLFERVHVTKEYAVPISVQNFLEEAVAKQEQFVRSEFGECFALST